ncbi:hypothetical protein [Abyssisolibacter fermentans]|uniref:hypothetical protein n=1 Tax=Abyssisolibacter fermentans TaxID=1766203 RepID=UPI0008309E13|nr:hypothetical protein [Abyssisolibacter fermentans]
MSDLDKILETSDETLSTESEDKSRIENSSTNNNHYNYADTLKTFSTVVFILSIIIALIVFYKFGFIKTSYYSTEINPIGIGVSLGIFAQGLLICLFASVVHRLTRDIIDIKSNTQSKKK